MKACYTNRLLATVSLGMVMMPAAALADTVTANATARTLAPNTGDQGALSLYNNGGNIQRSWLNFDLSAYSGKAIIGDVTMTLQAGIYGNFLTGVQLGTANSAWSAGTINWSNQPGLTTVSGVTNPSGTFGTGPVTWTIPWYVVEKWATSGYYGIGLTSGAGSTQHFYSLADGNPANHPTLTLTSANSTNGTWTGGSGNWTDSGNWASSTVAQGINSSATIDSGTDVTVTMDANRSVRALSFSNANHIIAAGAGKLALVTGSGVPSVTVASGSNANIAADVVGMDGLEKLGSGTLFLSGTNTYTGTTAVSAGTLSLTGTSSLPTSGPVSIAAGAKLSNDAAANTSFNLGALTLTGGTLAATATPNPNLGNFHLKGTVTVSGTTPSTISADVRVVQNDNRTFDVADDASGVDLLVSGKLGHYNGNSWGYATKTGAGTMKLTATPEIGSITVNAGKLILENAGADWQVSNGGLINNSQVEVSVSSGSRNLTAPISGGGSLTKTGPGTLSLSSTGMSGSPVNSYSGGTIINGGTVEIHGRSADNGGYTSLGTGPVTLNNGSTLVSANDWATGNEWNGGAVGLITLNPGSTWTINAAGSTVRNGLVLNGATVNGPGNNGDWGGMYLKSTSVTVGGNATSTISVDTAMDSAITMTVEAGSQLNYSGTLHNKIGANGGVTKAGAGTLTISGNNSYTGPTTVSNGKLVIDGNISTSNTTVENGGTLGGSGTVGNVTVQSGGTLAIGNSPGTMTYTGDLTLSLGSVSDFEINSFSPGAFDLALAAVSGTQTVNFNGGTLNLLFQSGFNTLGSIKIFDFDAYAGSGFTNVNSSGLASGFTASFNSLDGTITVVPEPRAALIGGLGLFALLRRRRA